MRTAGCVWLVLAAVGCVGHADGRAESGEAASEELAEASQLLLEGEPIDDVARAYPALHFSTSTHPVQPDPSTGGGSVIPKPPKGMGPISTPVEPGPDTTPPPVKPVRAGGDPAEPGPEAGGSPLPTPTVDPTMDPVEPQPATEDPGIPDVGDDAVSLTCRQECHVETHTECTTVAQDPVLGTGAKVRVCHEIANTICYPVCTEDPPNA